MTGQYNGCAFAPANPGNYSVGRITKVDTIVIHVTESDSAEGAVGWFQNPQAQVSAHYVVSDKGVITQCVKEEDTAWAAPTFNGRGIHIEHAGWTNKTTFPEAQLVASAGLVDHLAAKFGIPKDRIHIKGHSELPNQSHSDPGSTWPWAHYMALVVGGAAEPMHFWKHPDGIKVGRTAAFGMQWPSGTKHAAIVANDKFTLWEGGPDATAALSFNTPGPHTLKAIATDAAGHSLGVSTLQIVVS